MPAFYDLIFFIPRGIGVPKLPKESEVFLFDRTINELKGFPAPPKMCSEENSLINAALCYDEKLETLRSDMEKVYQKAVTAAGAEKRDVVRNQILWEAEELNTCRARSCLLEKMTSRIDWYAKGNNKILYAPKMLPSG